MRLYSSHVSEFGDHMCNLGWRTAGWLGTLVTPRCQFHFGDAILHAAWSSVRLISRHRLQAAAEWWELAGGLSHLVT